MREILFRGKTEDGMWYEGYYTKGFREPTQKQLDDIINHVSGKAGDWTFSYTFVIPETVSMFLGFHDIHKKKIFEGDIVKDNFGRIMEVVFKDKFAKFAFRLIKTTGEEWTNNFYFADINEWFYCDIPEVEIIGNKWDNPELLKGVEQ